MDDMNKRFGTGAQELRRKISQAFAEIESLSQQEIDSVWNEAMIFVRNLPDEKRGAFYWNSGLECLFLFTTESRQNKS